MGLLGALQKRLTGETDIGIYIADVDKAYDILFTFPIIPETFKLDSPFGSATVQTNSGDLKLIKTRGLKSVSWSSFFPDKIYDFIKFEALVAEYNCWDYIKTLEKMRDARKPMRLIIKGVSVDINILATLDSFTYGADSPGDAPYSLKFGQFRKIISGELF